MKTSFETSFMHCIDKLDIMKKLFLFLLLVPIIRFSQKHKAKVSPGFDRQTNLVLINQYSNLNFLEFNRKMPHYRSLPFYGITTFGLIARIKHFLYCHGNIFHVRKGINPSRDS